VEIQSASLGQNVHLGVAGVEPNSAECEGLMRRATPVFWIVTFVLTAGVMDQLNAAWTHVCGDGKDIGHRKARL
jgi:hypothetical protein